MIEISSTSRSAKIHRQLIKPNRIYRIGTQLVLVAILLMGSAPGRSAMYSPGPTAGECSTITGQITRMTVPSTVYAQPVSVSVYLPPCYESSAGQLPVIFLLHGGGTDETQWPDLRVQADADALIAGGAPPFVVIMPGGAYQADLDYAAFVLNDLIPTMSDRLHIRTDSAGRAIGGISLGGYWALMIAFHHPDQFGAVGGYSPVVTGLSEDLVILARNAEGLDRLRIALDVGDADALAEGTQRLAEALRARGLVVSYTTHSGGHNRPYWRSHTVDYLRFYLAPPAAPAVSNGCSSR